MSKGICIAFLALVSWSAVAAPHRVPREVLALIRDDVAYPLPRGLSADELRGFVPPDARARARRRQPARCARRRSTRTTAASSCAGVR